MAVKNIHPAMREGIHFNLGAWKFDMEHITDTKCAYFCTYHCETVMIDEAEFYKAFRKYVRETAVNGADMEAAARIQAEIESENPEIGY